MQATASGYLHDGEGDVSLWQDLERRDLGVDRPRDGVARCDSCEDPADPVGVGVGSRVVEGNGRGAPAVDVDLDGAPGVPPAYSR